MRQYFAVQRFWAPATNVGPFVLGVLAAPFIYRQMKKAYWCWRYNRLNKEEVLRDRLLWLRDRTIEAELWRVCCSGVQEAPQ